MKNVNEFIDSLVKISLIEDCDNYGHYPFQLIAETKDGGLEINALALGGDVNACYKRVRDYIKNEARKVYLSLDFPKGGDIENDFIAIFSFDDGETSVLAIPYNIETGERYETIHKSEQLDKVLGDFNYSLNPEILKNK